ncbi:S41 family peptidase [Luteolibacter sp. AS25]|uniref:S41 family peptidase n=1 Tax=Luteolibacter sp. AS25 TaxID=3135776 RepID=UPI00398B8570
MRSCFLALSLLFLNQAGGKEALKIEGLAWPALSPDGEQLVFEWLNDIWLAPSNGGEAVRVLKTDSREAYPKFSPDGKRIVFSSEKDGAPQLHSMKLDGSDLEKLSWQTEGNVLEAISPDGEVAISRGERDDAGYKEYRLLKTNLEKESREVILFDASAHSVAISPEGGRYLFCRKGEQLYRRGYHGSRASEIFLYDESKQGFQKLISEKWEARSPLWMPDGKGFYYVSNRDGTFNLWEKRLAGGEDQQRTFFKSEAVVIPVISMDGGVIVFRAGQTVYRYEPKSDKKPVEVKFFTNEKISGSSVRKLRVNGTTAVAFDGEARRIVFSAGGDLWMMAMGDDEPVRLTSSDEIDELEPQLSQDGETLYFLKDNGLEEKVCRASVDFKNGKILGEKVIADGRRSKKSMRISPDGGWLSWLEGTGDLVTASTKGGEPKVVMANWDMPTYDWSPDGKWLVAAGKDIHSNRDIWLVPSDGHADVVNLTRHPAFEGSPKWSPDGKTIVFVARRDTDELARLWIAEIGDYLENEDWNTLEVQPVETEISEPSRICWAEDSKSVLFQSKDKKDKTVYSLSIKSGKVSEFADFRGIPVKDMREDFSLWRIDRVPAVLRDGDLVEFEFSFLLEQDREKRLRLGFRRIWRTLGERFYDETMNETQWGPILEKYEDAAVAAFESRQFDRVVAQLLGELNASHLTFKTNPWGLKSKDVKVKKPTAHPGLEFENRWEGPLVVRRVIEGSPISKVKNPPVAGEIVLRIGGRDVDGSSPLRGLFNGGEDRAMPIVLKNKSGKERALELVPISYDEARRLNGENQIANAEAVAETSGLSYLRFSRMKSSDLRELEIEVYRASLGSKGLILDLRDNTGGRVADELLSLFCQPVHTFTVPRDGPRGYPTDRRVSTSWDGPMVVLCNENTFSNAEIFCHAFKNLGRGKLVGMPTNGGVISAVGIDIPEMGELQIPFRGWFHAKTGQDLELNGAVPDVLVAFDPADQVKGSDPQLEKAIEVLNEEVSEQGPLVQPKYKFEVSPSDDAAPQ